MSELPCEVVVTLTRHSDHWETRVEFDDKWVGGGTGPRAASAFDVAADILWGDTNDMLNDYHGALGQAEKDAVAETENRPKP